MIYIFIALIAVLSFAFGIFVAIRLIRKEYAGTVSTGSQPSVAGEAKVVSTPEEVLQEEPTRKVELVDFEDLLAVDGDVIEAEPAPLVPEEHLVRAHSQISILESKVRDLELREQSQQFVIEKLKKQVEENIVDENPQSLPEHPQ